MIDLNSFLLGMAFLAAVMAIYTDIIDAEKGGEDDAA